MTTKAKKPIIAVDIDEVLLPLHEHFLYHHNAEYGTDFVFPDPHGRYYLQDFTGEDWPVMIKKLRKFYSSGETKHLQPLPGAVAAIEQLHEQYDLVTVSNQQLFQGVYTKRALQKHFGDAFKAIYFTSTGRNKSKLLPKSELCKQAGASYLVDDSLASAADCMAAGFHVILFGDYHWHKNKDIPAGVTRCKDWQEVLEYFDAKN